MIPKFMAWYDNALHEVVELQWSTYTSHKLSRIILLSTEGAFNIRTVSGEANTEKVKLLQAVGRQDKHGDEMYEGHIIKYLDNTSKGFVEKIDVINDIRHMPDFTCSKWEEIIGTIFEQPELVPEEGKAS